MRSVTFTWWRFHRSAQDIYPDSKVHGANMGSTWVLSAPDGPHVGPMNLAIRVSLTCVLKKLYSISQPNFPRGVWVNVRFFFSQGCYLALKDMIEEHSMIVLGIAIGIGVVEVRKKSHRLYIPPQTVLTLRRRWPPTSFKKPLWTPSLTALSNTLLTLHKV